jgi:hypothetical protein
VYVCVCVCDLCVGCAYVDLLGNLQFRFYDASSYTVHCSSA